jgi:hypothetical protein
MRSMQVFGTLPMLRKAFEIVVTLILVGFGFWAIQVWREIYRAHILGFFVLWLILPVFAYYTAHAVTFRAEGTHKSVGIAFTTASILLSFSGVAEYGQIRDTIGQRHVSGYIATDDVEFDETGGHRVTDVSTDHWYSQFALWLFELLFLGISVGFPMLTYQAVKRGARSSC